GADRVLTMDLHAGQVQGFFEVPVDHMTALPMLAQYFRDLGLPEELVAVAPDTGRTRLAGKFAEMIGGDLAVLQKDRPAHNVAHITNVIGDVRGKCAVMTDDMVDTAGTLVAGAQFLKDHGAEKVFACATHGIFSPPAIERIEDSPLDSVIVTDTVPIDPLTKPERVTVLPIADILAVVLEGQETTHASILKDYQQDPIRGHISHVDLQEVRLDRPIQASVNVQLIGEPAGAKEGGVLSQVQREINVEALPMEVPEHIDLDVSAMAIGDTLRLADLTPIEGVTYLDNPEETVLATVTLPTR